MDYYVLNQGRSEGPFSESDLVDALSSGRYRPEDLAQEEGSRYWTPLRRLLADDSATTAETDTPRVPPVSLEASPAVADEIPEPELPTTFAAEGTRFWHSTRNGAKSLLSRFPYESGVALCVLGIVLLIASYAQIVIVGPVLIAALIAGGLTMLRGRVVAGLGICAAAIFIPALIWSVVQWAHRMLH